MLMPSSGVIPFATTLYLVLLICLNLQSAEYAVNCKGIKKLGSKWWRTMTGGCGGGGRNGMRNDLNVPAGCKELKNIGQQREEQRRIPVFECITGEDSLNFFITGDIGGGEYGSKEGGNLTHHPTSGQLALVHNMAEVMKENVGTLHRAPTKFVVNAGDNFYDNGVNHKTAPERFLNNFVNVYGGLRVPFFTIAGNNDYKEDAQIEAQINAPYPNWFFPSQFYVVKYKFGKSKAQTAAFVMIDTTVLCGASRKDFKKDENKDKKAIADKWMGSLQDALSKAGQGAHYLFVVGHYPVYVTEKDPSRSNAVDRSFGCAKKLQRMFVDKRVTAYLSGHEHNLKYVELELCNNVVSRQIVSGAGSRMEKCLEKKHVAHMDGHVKFCYPHDIESEEETVYNGGAFIDVKLTRENAHFEFWATGGKLYRYDRSVGDPVGNDQYSRVLLETREIEMRKL